MTDSILNVSRDEIHNALVYGGQKGYVLFPEIRNVKNRNGIKNHPVAAKMLQDLITYAVRLGSEDIPDLNFTLFKEFSETGNRLHYEQKYFESKQQINALVIAELSEGRGRYLSSIEERLLKWCGLYSWELPAHVVLTPEDVKAAGNNGPDTTVALYSAETAFYFSEMLSLIGEKMPPLLAERLQNEIARRVLEPYQHSTYSWETLNNNWASVCAGAVGCAAIYTVKGSDELTGLLMRVIRSMECFLSGFDADGVTPEGLIYWSYGFSFFVYFAELLKERTCGKIDLLRRHPKIKKIAELPLTLQFPDGHMVSFSDTPGDFWEGDYGLLCRLSDIFGIDRYRIPVNLSIFDDHTSKWAITSRNLFWGLDKLTGGRLDHEGGWPEQKRSDADRAGTGMFYFPESQWLIDRRLFGSASEPSVFCAFAAKGGNNGESHNHNDLGHFILFCGGDTLLADLGAPEYTKKYFSPQRYEILHASSRGHSVPVINDCGQAPGKKFCARVEECAAEDMTTRFKLDLSKAYDIKELNRFSRTFLWDYHKAVLNISDEFHFIKTPNSIQEVFITRIEPVIAADPGTILIKGKACTAELSFSKDMQACVLKTVFTNHFGEAESAYRICLTREAADRDCQVKLSIRIKMGD